MLLQAVAEPAQKFGEVKNLGGQMFDFKRITPFCLEKRHSKGKMTILSKNFGGGMAPLAPPGYAYGCRWHRPRPTGFLNFGHEPGKATEYVETYIPHKIPPAESFKPAEEMRKSDAKVSDKTTFR